jgi:hypothetical protein
MAFSKEANVQLWRYHTKGKRGYYVSILRTATTRTLTVKRMILPKETENGDLTQDIWNPPMQFELLCNSQGRGAIASRDIAEGEVIAEYLGQNISADEMRKREQIYNEKGLPVTCIYLGKCFYLDGNVRRDGTPMLIKDNVGAWLNHSRFRPNAVLRAVAVMDRKRYFIVAKTGIPTGCEIQWDYSDRRKGLEDEWIYR